ncbi:Permease of the drug/metabolite transporter (DMT) superfamily [hydrothermal vent metagenome]|uniref:Permease of the drug/metabolite transporter (DMT) superfamily n=1 Tax=hydrothermal vent metagenome TaxID=652676 RepID=A0A3B0S724_9ZZZZ
MVEVILIVVNPQKQAPFMPPSRNGFNWLSLAPALFVGLWATGFIGSRLSAPYAEPLSFLSVRFAIVTTILLVASIVMKAKWPTFKVSVWALITGAFSQGGYLGGVFWAIYFGMPAGVAALITALQPLLTAALAGMILGEKISPRHWTGLAIGLAGVAMVVWPKLTFTAIGITPTTLAVCFFATVSITLGSILQKRHLTNVDLRTGNTLQFAGGGLVVLIGALATENFEIIWNADVIFAMTWLTLVLSLGAITMLYLMIRHGEVSKVSSLFFLVPAVTVVIAYFLFDESLSPVQLVGMAVCAAAVLLVTRKPATK